MIFMSRDSRHFSLLIFFSSYGKIFAKLNVLLIVVDDLRPELGAYGVPNAVTPNIDKLAKEGVIFKNAFAQQALCGPSRTSFLTSRRPDTLHIYDVHSYWRSSRGNFITLPQYFKQNFYYTKSIGKIFHPGVSSNFTDDYPESWSTPAWHPVTEIYKNAPVCHTKEGSFANLLCPVNIKNQPGTTLPDIESTNEAIKFLKSVKKINKPFFLAVGYHKPHIPFKFPKKYAALHPIKKIPLPGLRYYPPQLPTVAWNPWNDVRLRHDIANLNLSYPFESFSDVWVRKLRQGYFASVSYIDNLIGKLLHVLKTTNLSETTIVALLGDHGWSLGEHGEWSKYSTFDVALRVPLIFRLPNNTNSLMDSVFKRQNVQVESPVELVDLFPTLVELTDLPPIPKCPKQSCKTLLCTDGKSLLPFIRQNIFDKETVIEKNYALSQYPRPGINPTKIPDSDQPRLSQIEFMGYSIRTSRYRYTEWVAWSNKSFAPDWSTVNGIEFYDHQIDPDENLNLLNRPGLENIQKNLAELLHREFDSILSKRNC